MNSKSWIRLIEILHESLNVGRLIGFFYKVICTLEEFGLCLHNLRCALENIRFGKVWLCMVSVTLWAGLATLQSRRQDNATQRAKTGTNFARWMFSVLFFTRLLLRNLKEFSGQWTSQRSKFASCASAFFLHCKCRMRYINFRNYNYTWLWS